jgi:hypothetical protein
MRYCTFEDRAADFSLQMVMKHMYLMGKTEVIEACYAIFLTAGS